MDNNLINKKTHFMGKTKFDFRLMNSLGTLSDEEFKVAYFILNTIGMNGGKRTKIFRAVLSELTGKSERTISRITDKLNEKGIIKKDLVSNGVKTSNYYSLSVTKNEVKLDNGKQKTEEILVTGDTLNKRNKNNNIDKNDNIEKSNNIEKSEIEREFELPIEVEDGEMETESDEVVVSESKLGNIPMEIVSEYLQLKIHPDEEEIYQYQKRTGRMRELLAEYPQLEEKFV